MSAQALRSMPEATPAPAQESLATWLARIVPAQREGRTCLPFHLGLSEDGFARLVRRHFAEHAASWLTEPRPEQRENGALRQELLELRRDEWQELRDLLLSGRAEASALEAELAEIVAAACLGGDHLWRDLGLDSRQQLHDLLHQAFPTLARRNVNNMRWKKFFYKQLCEQDGGYVCRSPSCEQCPTYHDCFGDES